MMDNKIKCKKCGVETNVALMAELKEMREAFWYEEETKFYLCPDCLYSIRSKDLEEQLDEILNLE